MTEYQESRLKTMLWYAVQDYHNVNDLISLHIACSKMNGIVNTMMVLCRDSYLYELAYVTYTEGMKP